MNGINDLVLNNSDLESLTAPRYVDNCGLVGLEGRVPDVQRSQPSPRGDQRSKPAFRILGLFIFGFGLPVFAEYALIM